jgi:hypothetical protein
MVFITATIYIAATIKDAGMKSSGEAPGVARVAALLEAAGWNVERQPKVGPVRPDLIASRNSRAFAVEVKASAEARAGRVLPLLAQAILQASAAAQHAGLQPLAIVHVGQVSRALIRAMDAFADRYAPDIAMGLVSDQGVRHFRGPEFVALNAEAEASHESGKVRPRLASDLFSDLNQWLLKVLLAPQLPEHLLSAPRGRYRNAAELSQAAGVSQISAFRFIRRMREEHFLAKREGRLDVVRRSELFGRWKVAAPRASPELGMCFLNPAGQAAQLRKVAARHGACLGLFAAADALGLGHVSGAVPCLYVEQMPGPAGDDWNELVPPQPGEPPGVILRRPSAPQAVFRGAVQVDGVLVSDVLQVWLDTSAHPSRGQEQADLIATKVLASVMGDGHG